MWPVYDWRDVAVKKCKHCKSRFKMEQLSDAHQWARGCMCLATGIFSVHRFWKFEVLPKLSWHSWTTSFDPFCILLLYNILKHRRKFTTTKHKCQLQLRCLVKWLEAFFALCNNCKVLFSTRFLFSLLEEFLLSFFVVLSSLEV